MPINPNIAMGVNPIQFKQSDPYDQFGKQLQLKKLLMGEQDDQTARAAIRASDGTPKSILAALVKSGDANPALYSAYQKMVQDADINASQKGLRDSQTAENMAKVEKAAADQHNAQLQHIQSAADLNGWVQSMYQHPILGPKISKMMPIEKYLSQMPQTPEQFQQWKAEQSMGTSEFLKANKPHFTTETANGKVTQLQTPSLFGGAPTVTRSTFAADPAKDLVLPDASGVYRPNAPVIEAKKSIAKSGASNIQNNLNSAGPKAFETELGKLDAKQLDDFRSAAQTAQNTLNVVGNLRDAESKGAYSGGGANARLAASTMIEGWTGIAPKGLVGSQLYNAEASKLVLDHVKALGANPSNADRTFIEKTVPQLATSKEAREQMANWMEQKASQTIATYQNADTYARANRGLGGFQIIQPRNPSAPPKPGGVPDMSAIDAEIARRSGGK